MYIRKRKEKQGMKGLEKILQENFNCKEPFLEEVVINEDGSRNPFTEEGAKAYGKLIDTLYSIDGILGIPEYSKIVENIVETLDDIADSMY